MKLHRTIRLTIALLLTCSLIFSSGLLPANQAHGYSGRTTYEGFNPTQKSGEWTTGNLGKGWAEGDWVPYRVTLRDVQRYYPNLDGFPDIEISYDFTRGTGDGGVRFVDMVRSIQVGTELGKNDGWPKADGTPYLPAEYESAKDAKEENKWTGFEFLNLPQEQVHRALNGGIGTPTDARRMIVVKRADILNAAVNDPSLETADTLIIYFQLHESRSFIWQNQLQYAYYEDEMTNKWGGYVYGEDAFKTDSRLGSGWVPGSSGHVQLQTGGAKTVPIPIPEKKPGYVSGYKFLDENELLTPLSGWKIFVHGNVDGIDFSAERITDENGYYEFNNLTNDAVWKITEAEQRFEPEEDGYTQTYPYMGQTVGVASAVQVSSDPDYWGWDVALTMAIDTQNNVNFHNAPPIPVQGLISGTKFHDRNADGIFDALDEEPLEGWKIGMFSDEDMTVPYLTDPLDPDSYFRMTDADGTFTFSDLPIGVYWLKEIMTAEQEEDYMQTTPVPNKIRVEILTGLDEITGLEFGNVAYGKICVLKQDSNEAPLEGWEFTLYIWDEDEEEWVYVDEGETDEEGKLCFEGLLPGLYKVEETLQTGWAYGTPDDGVIDDIQLAAGDTENLTFTNIELSKICVEKLDSNEEPLEGWEFTLYIWDEDEEEWVYVDEGETDEEGKLCFEGLLPGLYKVEETLQLGWAYGTPDDGVIDDIELAAGDTENLTFTNIELGKICVEKRDVAGALLGGWEFRLWVWNDDEDLFELYNGDGEPQTTDLEVNDGKVCWTDLMPGDYRVEEVMTQEQIDEGWEPVTPLDGLWEGTLAAGESKSLTFVNRMEEPECETALARMNDVADDFTYKFEGHPWFTYLKFMPTYDGDTFYFYAAQYNKVGEVDIRRAGDFLLINVTMCAGFELDELHIDVRLNTPTSNAFGTYPYNKYVSGNGAEIPWEEAWDGQELYIVVHGVACGFYPSTCVPTGNMYVDNGMVTMGTLSEMPEDEPEGDLEEGINEENAGVGGALEDPPATEPEDPPLIEEPEEEGRPENPGGHAPGRLKKQ